MNRGALLSAVLVVLAIGGVASAYTLPWEDAGWEVPTDFTTGPWEVGDAMWYAGYAAEWDFTRQSAGGSPNGYVAITDPTPTRNIGHAFVGQHITVPEGFWVVSCNVGLDVRTGCLDPTRPPTVGLALFTASTWSEATAAGSPPVWDGNNIPSLWRKDLFTGTCAWTSRPLPGADATNLKNTLNAHRGEDLVLATYLRDAQATTSRYQWYDADNFAARIEVAPELAPTVPWQDPGFESTTDFTTGPWEIGLARILAGSYVAEYDLALESSGGNPDGYVSMTDTHTGYPCSLGYALLGQHISSPAGVTVLSCHVSLDAQLGSSDPVYPARLGLALFTASEWSKMDIAQSPAPIWREGHSTNEVSSLWRRNITLGNYADWTAFTLWEAALLAALNAHTGEDLVLATYFDDEHVHQTKWCKVDNFAARITVIPEPASLLVLGGGLVALFGRRRRRGQ